MPAEATIHTNRKQPLLYQFTLRPGPVTYLRISQAQGSPRMVLGFGEMLRAPMAFTGTSGVVAFDAPAGTVLDTLMGAALEHHLSLVYGEHRAGLRAVAFELGLPVLELA